MILTHILFSIYQFFDPFYPNLIWVTTFLVTTRTLVNKPANSRSMSYTLAFS